MLLNRRRRVSLAVVAACGNLAGISPSRSQAQTFIYTGVGSSNWNTTVSNTNFINSSSGMASAFANGDTVQFDDTATGSTNITVPAAIQDGSAIFDNNTKNYTFSGATVYGSSAANLTFNGTGTVTFNNSNSYSSTTAVAAINDGTVILNGSSATLTVASLNIASGALFSLNAVGSSAISTSGTVIDNGTFNISNGSAVSPYTLGGTGTVNVDSTSTLNLTNSVVTSPFTGNLNVAPGGTFNKTSQTITVLGGSNSLSGNTIITAGTLQMGTANLYGVSAQPANANLSTQPGSLTFGGSSNGANMLDLDGASFNVTSLSSSNPQSTITSKPVATMLNPGPTLYVSPPAGNWTYAGQIIQYNPSGSYYSTAAPVSLVFSGTGNQILTGNNSYAGGTTINSGTVTPESSTGLGTGPVALAGGNLSLVAPTTTLWSGLASGVSATQFQVNNTSGNPGIANYISNGVLSLTDGSNTNEETSAFTNQRVAIPSSGFTVKFTYTATAGSTPYLGEMANGATFTLENDPNGSSAIGSGASGLGYGGIQNSFAVCLNLYPYSGTAIASGGVIPSGYTGTSFPLVQQGGAVPLQVTISYNPAASSVTESFADSAGALNTYVYSGVNLTSILGASSAYLGFTGSTSSYNANQNISNFSFSSNTPGPLSIANAITGQAGTSSRITLADSTGASGYASGTVGPITIEYGSLITVVSTTTSGGASRGILSTPGISLSGGTDSWTGRLDLGNNAVDIQSGDAVPNDLATITNELKQGYAGGTWQGSGGITSTAAASDTTHLTALGVVLNDNGLGSPLYGAGGTVASTFEGTVPGDFDLLIKYTYYGDANLDGKVDGSDYTRIDNGSLNHLTGWSNGDFNYDGVVNGSDYTLIDNVFNTQGASLASSIEAVSTAQLAEAGVTSQVPEPPAAVVAAAAGGVLLLRRRRTFTRIANTSSVLDSLR